MSPFRVGFGYDSHRFGGPERKLTLGGVEFPGETGLAGHSDADVLIHAIIDSLLGAAALGDIGSHFPDTDEKWAGADSAKLLEAVVAEVYAKGYEIGNIDATVVCERPRLSPKIALMRQRLSEIAGIEFDAVSIKGKTNERMDDVGLGLGIEAHAVSLLVATK